ncbi:hypothetical protein EDC01DRAFT_759866 [Geopyxis carbonaria]|nr:hypothetical protein EDC01DRAFT_759866 [Geopyxis carbonaria]
MSSNTGTTISNSDRDMFQRIITIYHLRLASYFQYIMQGEEIPEDHVVAPNIADWEITKIHKVMVNFWNHRIRFLSHFIDFEPESAIEDDAPESDPLHAMSFMVLGALELTEELSDGLPGDPAFRQSAEDHLIRTTPVDPKTIQAELFGPTIKQYQTLLAISWHFATNGTEQFPSNYNSLVDVGDWTHDKLRRILSNYLRFVQQMELKAREFCKEENDESHHCVSTCAKPGPWRTEIFCAWAAIRSIDLKGPDGSFDEGGE